MKLHKKTGIKKFDFALLSLDNHLNISGKSLSTRKTYSRCLHSFILVSNKIPEECSKEEIIACILMIKENRGFKSATLKHYIYSIKYYLTHIAERMDLISKIPIPYVKKYNIHVLTSHEIYRMFEACKSPKERFVIQLLYDTGIRVGELTRLCVNDFDFYNHSILIRDSKNRKTRTVYFGKNFTKTFNEYYNSTKTLFSDFFLNKEFHPFLRFSKKRVNKILKDLAKRSRIKHKISAHSFRHAFAVHYLNFGGTIYQLQKLLGHSYLSTTCHYLQYAILPESKNFSVLDKLHFESQRLNPILRRA